MKLLVFSAKDFEIPFLKEANKNGCEVVFSPDRLTTNTAMKALGFRAISIFSADDASTNVLEKLHDFGVEFICLRSTGHDNVHLPTASKFNIHVANAPGYSPNAIAEHAIGLLLAANRQIVRSNTNVKNNNFALSGMIGFDLFGKRVGVLGTGAIGSVIVKVLHGFGCEILANDLSPDTGLEKKYDLTYVDKNELYANSDVIILALPHTSETHQLICEDTLAMFKPGCLLVNIARGAIIKTEDVLQALDMNVLSGYAADVYAKEGGIFFYDHSGKPFKDKLLKRLVDHPNVILTPHQAFATKEALAKIAEMTFSNLIAWEGGERPANELT